MRMQAPDAGGQHPPSAPELIDKNDPPVARHGHEIAGRKPGEPLLAHADSFVAEREWGPQFAEMRRLHPAVDRG